MKIKIKNQRPLAVALSIVTCMSMALAANLSFAQATNSAGPAAGIKIVNGTTHESVELSSFPMGTLETKVIPASRVPVSMLQPSISREVIPKKPAPQFPIVTARELADPIQRNWAVSSDSIKPAQPLFSQSGNPKPIESAHSISAGAGFDSFENENQTHVLAPVNPMVAFDRQQKQVRLASMQNGSLGLVDEGVPVAQGNATANLHGNPVVMGNRSMVQPPMSFSQPGFRVENADLFPVDAPPRPEITGRAFPLPQPRTFSLFGGWGFQDEDRPFGEGGFFFPTTLDDGYLVGIASGKRWSPRLRTEMELSYRRNEIENFFSGFPYIVTSSYIYPYPIPSSRGEIHGYSGMANVYFDFDRDPGAILTPYVGTGIGMTFLDVDVTSGWSGETISNESMFAFQVMAGVTANLGPRTDFFMEYRFFKTTIDDFYRSDSPGPYRIYNSPRFEYGVEESNLIMGLRLKY